MPVVVPQGVQVTVAPGRVTAKGPKGQLEQALPAGIKAELKDGKILLTADGGKEMSALYGMSRARVNNIVKGVHEGFSKTLDIVGLGFKAAVEGDKLTLKLGFSHPVSFPLPKSASGKTMEVKVDPKSQAITITDADKDLVGETAARIRHIKEPEPYKGTGIRYRGEHIIKKAGKTAAGMGVGGATGAGAGAKK
ncbi:MAG: 50S ribosomal protein L6 [Elusimicrobia bacterium]|nr:50S ribosomal protein L6 [Elusimicrobiota bacterium]